MITYTKESPGITGVVLDGRKIGKIKHDHDGYRYYPKGEHKSDAQAFPTLAKCKASLEGDD